MQLMIFWVRMVGSVVWFGSRAGAGRSISKMVSSLRCVASQFSVASLPTQHVVWGLSLWLVMPTVRWYQERHFSSLAAGFQETELRAACLFRAGLEKGIESLLLNC